MEEILLVESQGSSRGEARAMLRQGRGLVSPAATPPVRKAKDRNDSKVENWPEQEEGELKPGALTLEDLNIRPCKWQGDQDTKELEKKQKGSKGERSSQGNMKKVVGLSVVMLATLLSCPSASEAAILADSKQHFSQECLELLKLEGYDCPDFTTEEVMRRKCCPHHPLYFHCQMKEIHGTTYAVLACMIPQTVPPGKIGGLFINETGLPEVDLDSDCEEGTYRSENISSSLNRYGYCLEPKSKPRPGEEACPTGPTANDLLYCQENFTSECSRGFNQHRDYCHCHPYDCGEGFRPFRNFSGPCSDSNTVVEYKCIPVVGALATSTVSHQAISPDTGNNSTKAPPQQQHINITEIVLGVVGAMVVGAMVVVVVVVAKRLGFFCWLKSLCAQSSSNPRPTCYSEVSTFESRV